MLDNNYDYVTVNVTLIKATLIANAPIDIPDGKVVAIGAAISGNPEDRIIDLGIFKNNNAVVQPADYRFSQKTNGGTFVESMRPVNFEGGFSMQARLSAYAVSATEDITVQVLFMIYKGDQ